MRSVPPTFLLTAACLLAACTQQPARNIPVVPGTSTPAMPESAAGPETGAGTATPSFESEPLPPSQPGRPPRQLADGSQLPAVQGLLGAADRALGGGNVELAAVNLERAQRLAPQSAVVYERLAKVRLQQKRPAEAEQMARKALAFAGTPVQQARLWRLIAAARLQQGRTASAQEASARAAELEAQGGNPL